MVSYDGDMLKDIRKFFKCDGVHIGYYEAKYYYVHFSCFEKVYQMSSIQLLSEYRKANSYGIDSMYAKYVKYRLGIAAELLFD